MINSDGINHGINKDKGLNDHRYVRCARCGWICHLDRDSRDIEGSGSGQALVYTSMAYNTDYMYNAPLVYNGTRALYDPVVTGGCPQCGTLLY
jgi:hypothetical protein